MAISLKQLKTTTAIQPPRVLIYAPPGMGKTTLANEFPDPIFIQTEQGEGTGMEIKTFGLLTSYTDVYDSISAIGQELANPTDPEFKCQTVVVDSLDKLEPLIWQETCARNKWEHIESPGYGKGYLAADDVWRELVNLLNLLRTDFGVTIVLLAHSVVERFDDPRTSSYSRFDIRLHKRGQAIVEDEVDMIAFINQEASVKEEDTGFNKKRTHAEGGTQRWIYCEGRPSMNAKNRYNIPPKLQFKKGEGYKVLAPYFPQFVQQAQAPATQAEQPAQSEQKEAAAA